MRPDLGAVKALVPTQFLSGSAAALYTAPQAAGSSVAVVHSLVLANTDTAARTVTLYNVAPGDSPTGSNTILAAVSIPANTTWIGRYDEGCLVIPGGGSLQGFADSADKVTVSFGGKEYL